MKYSGKINTAGDFMFDHFVEFESQICFLNIFDLYGSLFSKARCELEILVNIETDDIQQFWSVIGESK